MNYCQTPIIHFFYRKLKLPEIRNSLKNRSENKSPFEILFEPFKNAPEGHFSGLHGALCPLLLAFLARQPTVSLVIVPTPERAKVLVDETRSWLGAGKSRVNIFLPQKESIYDKTLTDPATAATRISAFSRQISGGGVVVCSAIAVTERFFSPAEWRAACLKLSSGQTLSYRQLVENLARMNYRRVNLVEEPGQFSVRGGLLDVFPPGLETPLRLDFFGDELETIKTFSPESQRTLEKVSEAVLSPSSEILVSPGEIEEIVKKAEVLQENMPVTKSELLKRHIERLLSNPSSLDFKEMKPFVSPGAAFLWEFWDEPRIFIESFDQFEENLYEFEKNQRVLFSKLGDLTPLLPPENYYHSSDSVLAELKNRKASRISQFKEQSSNVDSSFSVELLPSPIEHNRDSLLKELRGWVDNGWAVAIVIENPQRFHNLKGLLGERGFPVKSSPEPFSGMAFGKILMIQGCGRRGFIDKNLKIAVLCEEDLYLQLQPERKTSKVSSSTGWSFEQLVPGDLVVHTEHGVAEFSGIQTMTAAGHKREYLVLQYAGSDRLFVPTDQVHKVQKYIGMEGFRPTIHSLNSKIWDTQKRRVKNHVEKTAKELLELYAKRQASRGFAFLPDGELQKEMESRFPFVETPDQAKAIAEVKADLEKPVPMDRVVCGDVGYGKTEVAIRSAFKAVCSGKQVAVLAPTTLLAFQHYQTFSNRLNGMPVKVAMLSRLVPVKKQKATVSQVRSGLVDILIGTHRILSKDIAFKDLGLVIIDEEQRFGVKHKEKFKEMRTNIDVLTLSATPIPRTLHMALSGIRQISLIDTPPLDRRPIQTYVAPFDGAWVKRAILEELRRGGQVYYVFNRVERIWQKAAYLRELVPEARIAVAHGQMEERNVETTMLSFIRREYDVLLSTTIIESGLDIPNVNTLIVDEAERLGLAQMYQLRGRVGRSSRQAWAFFFYTKGKKLTREAYERLATIEEHTALGSGFKIAMRDLQIRGAGNILGKEQSGHIAAVGFSLYIELLEEAVRKVKGETISKAPETAFEIPVSALLPSTYIPDDETRIELYARIGRCAETTALDLLRVECEDRFGKLPEEAARLFKVASLRVIAAKLGISKITRQLGKIRFEFFPDKLPDPQKVINLKIAFFKKMSMDPNDPNALQIDISGLEGDQILDFVEDFLSDIS